ncbi:MAG: hypothetical protein R3E90_13905 [Marinicella sp.]
MKTSIKYIFFLILFCQNGYSNICKTSSKVESQYPILENKFKQLNSELPHTNEVDDISMDEVIFNGENLCYEFSMSETTTNENFSKEFTAIMKSSFAKHHCKEKLIQPFIKDGGTIYYI